MVNNWRRLISKSTGTREATSDEIGQWLAATEVRRTIAPRTRDDIIRHLKTKNPHRVRRLRGDFKWLQKEFVKMGLNPEDARDLL